MPGAKNVTEAEDAIDDVVLAVKALEEEISLAINAVQSQATLAERSGNADEAHRLFEKIRSMRSLKRNASIFAKQWSLAEMGNVVEDQAPAPEDKGAVDKEPQWPAPVNGRTPEHAFRSPVLEALVQLGGQAPVGDVLAAVERAVKDKLTGADLAYDDKKGSTYWRNAARWARQQLVRDGLVFSPSRGVWAITDKGRTLVSD